MNSQPVIEISDLTKRYGELTALDSLSLSLNSGDILGFIGPNGAGKTTTIKILVGLIRPTSGTARIAGHDCVKDAHRIKHLVGYMPDRFGSYDNMRVREYLDFFGAAFRISRRERQKRIPEVLETTSSLQYQDRYVESLSHGMQQRIGIARTLLHDPQVLILDEPANGLDPESRVEMRNLILRLAQLGKTLIVTSHILSELSRICDRVAILTHGKLRALGTLDEIMERVRQQRMIEVQMGESADIAAAAEAIRGMVEEDAEVTVADQESIVRFRTAQTDETLGDMLAHLIQAGHRVLQFRELPTDLEDAFLSVTQQTKSQAPQQPAAASGEIA